MLQEARVKNIAEGRRVIKFIFVAVACLVTLGMVVDYVVGLRALRLNRVLARGSEQIRQLEQFASTIKDVETGQRGFLLTGEEGYLAPYETGRAKVKRELGDLQRLASRGELAAREVERVADLTAEKLAEVEKTIHLRREHGLDAAMEVVRSGRGRQLMEEIRLVVGLMEARKQREFADSTSRAVAASIRRTATFILTGVVNLVFLVWAYRRLRREMVEREAQERTGRMAKERLAAIVESSQDAIISKALDGTIQTWNEGAERMFGYAMDEAIGKPITLIVPPERMDEESYVERQVAQGERIEHFETVRLTKDGQAVDVSLAVSPLRDDEGRVVGAAKVLRNISARKRAEQELAKARKRLEVHAQELESAVTERTKQLREMIGELEAFCYSLSHDMRTPLRAIQSYAQLVLEEEGKRIGPECTGYLRKSISAAERMDQLIQDVLAFTRLSREQIRLEPLNVDQLVQDIVQERPELQPSAADIVIESPLLRMRGHGASLTQCVTNLLDNAVKFVPRGVTPHVRVYSERRNGLVRLCFQDNGIGIERGAHQRLFGMFQRMHRNEQYEGTGIGLAIVRKASERMGGQVGFESEVGKGSRFWVELPAVDS